MVRKRRSLDKAKAIKDEERSALLSEEEEEEEKEVPSVKVTGNELFSTTIKDANNKILGLQPWTLVQYRCTKERGTLSGTDIQNF